MSGENKDLKTPPPSYEECSKDYPPCQANDPTLSGYPGTKPTGHAASPGYIGVQHMGYAVQPGFQPGFQPPPECQQGVPPFFHQGQPWYPTQQPHPGIHYHHGSYSGQQHYEQQQLIPGKSFTTTQFVGTMPVQHQRNVVTTTPPQDYLCLAILAVICFCPLGTPAIIYASDANKLAMEGKLDGAKLMAESAQGLSIASIVIGVIAIVVIIVIIALT